MSVSNDELVEAILRPIHEAIENQGLTPTYLAKKLKRELNAKQTKLMKLNGALQAQGLPKNTSLVGITGQIRYVKVDGETEEVYGDGQTLLAINMVAWDVRQKARQDAHKLLGHYPAVKHELTGKDGGPIKMTLTDRLKALETDGDSEGST